MDKKVTVVGTGAQGSTIAMRLDREPHVDEIICADYDSRAAEELSNSLDKARALQLDARDVNKVIKAAKGCDLVVNGLPLEFNLIIMEAALAVMRPIWIWLAPWKKSGSSKAIR